MVGSSETEEAEEEKLAKVRGKVNGTWVEIGRNHC
jgi:hypothetical protein